MEIADSDLLANFPNRVLLYVIDAVRVGQSVRYLVSCILSAGSSVDIIPLWV